MARWLSHALCEMKFNSVSNPSITEIKWAYSTDEWPHQEWDLFLSWKQDSILFIELATDHKCVKQTFFRHMLYFIVCLAFKGLYGENGEFLIKNYLKDAEGIKHGDIQTWVKRTQHLLKNPETFEYDEWCGGLLANYDFT